MMLPGIGEAFLPMRIRLGLAIALAVLAAPLIDRSSLPASFEPVTFSGLALAEAGIGLIAGIAVRLMVMALQYAGTIAAQSTALAQMAGPGLAPEPMPAIGNTLLIGGLTLAMVLDLHIKAVLSLAASYEVLGFGAVPVRTDVIWFGLAIGKAAFDLAFSLAAPFILAAFLYNVSLGLINRAMPQLMVAFVGAPSDHRGDADPAAAFCPHQPASLARGTRCAPRRTAWPAMSQEEGQGGGEKTHEPTPQRLKKAREKGDVPKSDEVTTVAVYLGLIAAGYVIAGSLTDRAGLALAAFLDRADRLGPVVFGPDGGTIVLGLAGSALAGLLPLAAIPAGFAICGLIAQQAIVVSGSKLVPKLSRISPIQGAKNKFGLTGLVEFAKRVVKLAAVATVVVYLAIDFHPQILGAATAPPAAQVGLMFELLLRILISVAIVAGAIAALDLAWVRFDHRRKLKMTYQELKEETKEAEGDPHLKGKRRRRAVEIATGQMLSDVERADVVIVNPTHYAVALEWSRAPGSAPVCIAKGTDLIAARIREIAQDNNVPVHSDPPTARTLHAIVEVGDEIPADHYRAVAVAIRFADEMRRKARARGH